MQQQPQQKLALSKSPEETPTHFELAVNLVTAKALAIVIPSALLVTADEVIE